MIIKIKYRAIKWDNHQGGSGMPFFDNVYIDDLAESLSVSYVIKRVKEKLDSLESQFVGEVERISTELIF